MEQKSILNGICRWRTELMGIAILWVVVFHSQIVLEEPFAAVKTIGYGGVDIFLLLSGVGMYYSLQKKDELLLFYKKRIRRIAPAYLPFITVWCIWKLKNVVLEPVEYVRIVVGNLFMTGWINDVSYQFNWYVQVICWLYFFTPILYHIIIECKKRWQKLLVFLVGLAIGIPFFCDLSHLMGASRVPIFLMGLLWANEAKKEQVYIKDRKKALLMRILVLIAAVAGFVSLLLCVYRFTDTLWAYGTWWYPFLLITPGLCYLLSMGMEILSNIPIAKIALVPLKYIGKASFEIYLTHIAIFDFVTQMIGTISNRQWLKIMILAIVAGIIFHFLIEGILQGFAYIRQIRRKTIREEEYER